MVLCISESITKEAALANIKKAIGLHFKPMEDVLKRLFIFFIFNKK